ncbi:putative ADP,ATP carrier protein 1, mitochondrial precursor, putative,ADP/ATP translocase 1 [Trypanosoma cruzi]|uniref:ADP/ATP translocase n=2 Tax=Trypanosoma cruzi TaxID=5693 RepID=V5BNE7_TRYCR|nr:ADP,ATP carrier protein 1 [Trypanosoma cruzi Dm28c]KAF8290108.1 putative ADP/ATP mitochondrial carrier protein [Trypanosoma cruzi]PBJ76851.1 ADP/ATP mitochondrial carrier protein [Trypanosoma cruzi cruzi]PWU90230.1 putative ADP/ATP mitochondrial carrier protein [Trypanosoma cruzi]RNF10726.1 putative ADP,ATP carrier protein 1, mitochondrial precursor, putative,ADP/ATP translocase 1 [Trypanosoma cruzi]
MAEGQPYGYAPSSGEVMVDMAASLVGVFLQRVVMAPSHRITVLTVVEAELVHEGRLPSTGFGGIIGCVRRVYAKEGLRSFFRGFLIDAVLAVPSAVMEEVSSSLVSELLGVVLPFDRVQQMSPLVWVTLSLVSTSMSVLIATPVTGIQNTIVTNYVGDIVAPHPAAGDVKEYVKEGDFGEEEKEESYKYNSAWETAADIRRRYGFRGFYRGFGLDAMAVFMYRGTYYYALQILPPVLHNQYPHAVACSLAIVARCITQPFEVISRRMQLTASSERKGYKGMVDCARTIVAEEGYSGLWAGLRLRLLVTCVWMAAVELRRLY